MNTKTLILPSFAKINWFLRVLGKREDDYHELCTAFQTISLQDSLSFEVSEDIVFTCNDKNIPTSEKNLVVRSAIKLADEFKVKHGAIIHLEKKIPFPGGLGGGSSNAAITLLALAKIWEISVRLEELVEIGAEIGADVPFFFYGGTALGTDRGNRISEVAQQREKNMLIVTPNVDVSTAKAFSKLDAQGLTKNDSKSILQNCCDDAERLELGQLDLVNDFEKVIFGLSPKIESVKNKLLDQGARIALMTGSGASVFGVFDNEEKRQAAFESFQSDNSMRVFRVETVSRDEYRDFLKPCDSLLKESL